MITSLIALFFIHFVADFVAQTRKMGENKSSSNKWLTIHVLVYSAFFIGFGWKFALANFVLHWLTDWCSSRVTKWAYENKRMEIFWATIGFDQFIHTASLLLTYKWLVMT